MRSLSRSSETDEMLPDASNVAVPAPYFAIVTVWFGAMVMPSNQLMVLPAVPLAATCKRVPVVSNRTREAAAGLALLVPTPGDRHSEHRATVRRHNPCDRHPW